MISEIEKNQNIVTVGDSLIYSDIDNLQTWVVTSLFDGGFTAVDEFKEEDMFLFSELQKGWEFTSRTRQNKKIIL